MFTFLDDLCVYEYLAMYGTWILISVCRRIASCSLTAACCSDLASVLTVNRSLTELNLSWNDLGDCGFRQLCTGLKHPGCRIQTLLVASCSLTGSSCSELASVLSTSQFLTEIQLYHDSLGDSGMIQLCEGLRHPKCKMQTLRLSRCSFTAACCGSLAMALSANSSLTVLDLGENELGCQGLILLSEALKHPGCRVRTLGLTDSFRTDSGSEEVPSALTTSQSSS
ncbi:NACHT, LRR and PYD domains-containing protein 3-like [Ambystoma mexicanum]|uniref:NACHT, LRR and PYD domains-containing protein 3-like n=1 Tax=Ambystoma mexicanum TaxID=8296 RepID=UPI0037E73FBB